MDNPFAPWLTEDRTVILDGGLGTELERRGHQNLGRLWSTSLVASNPAVVREVHRDYLAAGADVIATATFQAALPTLLECGYDRESAVDLLREAVRLAVRERDDFVRQAGGRRTRLVAASIGPFGAHLADGSEYTGRYTLNANEIADFQRERWQILADAGADLIACETMPTAADVQAVVRLLRETPQRWAWISLVCRDASHLADGTPLPLVFEHLNDVPNLAAVGINCIPPRLAPAAIETLRSLTSLPIAVYPNASNAWDMEARQPLDQLGAAEFAGAARVWKSAGAQIIGGCCRTTPEHIAAIHRSVMNGG